MYSTLDTESRRARMHHLSGNGRNAGCIRFRQRWSAHVGVLFITTHIRQPLLDDQMHSPSHPTADPHSIAKVEAQELRFLYADPDYADKRSVYRPQLSNYDRCCQVGAMSVNLSRSSKFSPRGCRSLARGSSPRAESCVSCIYPLG